jgi:hypothetical protein
MTQRISPVIVNVPQVGTEGRMKTTQYTDRRFSFAFPTSPAVAAEDVIDSERTPELTPGDALDSKVRRL